MEEELKISNQFCFPIYSLAKEMIAGYRPILEELDLTYPQYLVMMLLWERQELTVSQIGELVNLDNSTVTPIIKRLEQKQLIEKRRNKEDERVVKITLTNEGKTLEQEARQIPLKVFEAMSVAIEDWMELKLVINRILKQLKKQEEK